MEFFFLALSLGAFSPVMLLLVFVGVLTLVSLSVATLINTYLYSYLVFMFFMSGVVILLMYMCGVILIEKTLIFYRLYYLLMGSFMLMVVSVSIYKLDPGLSCLAPVYLSQYYEFFSVMKFMCFSYSIFSVFFILYLFICLIIIYEIVKKCSGPLRIKS